MAVWKLTDDDPFGPGCVVLPKISLFLEPKLAVIFDKAKPAQLYFFRHAAESGIERLAVQSPKGFSLFSYSTEQGVVAFESRSILAQYYPSPAAPGAYLYTHVGNSVYRAAGITAGFFVSSDRTLCVVRRG